MAESVYRSGRKKGFTTVYRSVAQDKRLSLKARGLFLLLQSLPDDWTLTQARLAKLAGCGRDQIRAALAELRNVGYLIAEQSHDPGGKFSGAVYILQEEAPEDGPPLSENPTTVTAQTPPLSGKPSTGKPATEKPSTENPTLREEYSIYNTPPKAPHGGGVCETDPGANGGAKTGAKSGAKRGSVPKWKPERFEKFWEFYRTRGRGEARQKAVSAWDRLRPDDDLIALMGQALLRQTASATWRRGIGIPYASSWLNGRRWEDTPVTTPPDAPASDDGLSGQEVFGWQT